MLQTAARSPPARYNSDPASDVASPGFEAVADEGKGGEDDVVWASSSNFALSQALNEAAVESSSLAPGDEVVYKNSSPNKLRSRRKSSMTSQQTQQRMASFLAGLQESKGADRTPAPPLRSPPGQRDRRGAAAAPAAMRQPVSRPPLRAAGAGGGGETAALPRCAAPPLQEPLRQLQYPPRSHPVQQGPQQPPPPQRAPPSARASPRRWPRTTLSPRPHLAQRSGCGVSKPFSPPRRTTSSGSATIPGQQPSRSTSVPDRAPAAAHREAVRQDSVESEHVRRATGASGGAEGADSDLDFSPNTISRAFDEAQETKRLYSRQSSGRASGRSEGPRPVGAGIRPQQRPSLHAPPGLRPQRMVHRANTVAVGQHRGPRLGGPRTVAHVVRPAGAAPHGGLGHPAQVRGQKRSVQRPPGASWSTAGIAGTAGSSAGQRHPPVRALAVHQAHPSRRQEGRGGSNAPLPGAGSSGVVRAPQASSGSRCSQAPASTAVAMAATTGLSATEEDDVDDLFNDPELLEEAATLEQSAMMQADAGRGPASGSRKRSREGTGSEGLMRQAPTLAAAAAAAGPFAGTSAGTVAAPAGGGDDEDDIPDELVLQGLELDVEWSQAAPPANRVPEGREESLAETGFRLEGPVLQEPVPPAPDARELAGGQPPAGRRGDAGPAAFRGQCEVPPSSAEGRRLAYERALGVDPAGRIVVDPRAVPVGDLPHPPLMHMIPRVVRDGESVPVAPDRFGSAAAARHWPDTSALVSSSAMEGRAYTSFVVIRSREEEGVVLVQAVTLSEAPLPELGAGEEAQVLARLQGLVEWECWGAREGDLEDDLEWAAAELLEREVFEAGAAVARAQGSSAAGAAPAAAAEVGPTPSGGSPREGPPPCGGTGSAGGRAGRADSWAYNGRRVEVLVRLRDAWAGTVPSAGDRFNVVWSRELVNQRLWVDAWSLVSLPYPGTRQAACPPRLLPVVEVSSAQHMLVLHPDVLIAPTRVTDMTRCERQAVLKELLPAGDSAVFLVFGSLKHELFEFALVQNCFATDKLRAYARKVCQRSLLKLYEVRSSEEKAKEHLYALIPTIQEWAARELSHTAPGGDVMSLAGGSQAWRPRCGGRAPPLSRGAPPQSCRVVADTSPAIQKVLMTEENVWSPMWGMKGKVDATMLVRVASERAAATFQSLARVYPLELKSGRKPKAAQMHEAQVMLYHLLLSDRYRHAASAPAVRWDALCRGGGVHERFESAPWLPDVPPKMLAGAEAMASDTTVGTILYAGGDGQQPAGTGWGRKAADAVARLHRPPQQQQPQQARGVATAGAVAASSHLVVPARESMASLVNLRNVLAQHLSHAASSSLLPPMQQDPHTCKGCECLEVCVLSHTSSGGSALESGLEDVWHSLVGHLQPAHIEYYRKWSSLVDLENGDMVRARREIWRTPAPERERHGVAFAGMRVAAAARETDPSGTVPAYYYVLQRWDAGGQSLADVHGLSAGELVVLSVQGDDDGAPTRHAAVRVGSLVEVSLSTCVVRTEYPLHVPWAPVRRHYGATRRRVANPPGAARRGGAAAVGGGADDVASWVEGLRPRADSRRKRGRAHGAAQRVFGLETPKQLSQDAAMHVDATQTHAPPASLGGRAEGGAGDSARCGRREEHGGRDLREAAEWGLGRQALGEQEQQPQPRAVERSTSEAVRSIEGIPALQPVSIPREVMGAVWRVDKDEIMVGVRTLKENLIRLLVDSPGSRAKARFAQSNRELEVEPESADKENGRQPTPRVKCEGAAVGAAGGVRSPLKGSTGRKDALGEPVSHPTPGDPRRRRLVIDLEPPEFLQTKDMKNPYPWCPPTYPGDHAAVVAGGAGGALAVGGGVDELAPTTKRRREAGLGASQPVRGMEEEEEEEEEGEVKEVASTGEGRRGVDTERKEGREHGEVPSAGDAAVLQTHVASSATLCRRGSASASASAASAAGRGAGDEDEDEDEGEWEGSVDGEGSDEAAEEVEGMLGSVAVTAAATDAERVWRARYSFGSLRRVPGVDPWSLAEAWNNLNLDQRRAVYLALRAKDYALIQGMPGTGKTTLIVFLVRAFLAQGHSVLLTSHTHTAVDNVLLKLAEANVDFLRLGKPASIHPDVRPYALHFGDAPGAEEEAEESQRSGGASGSSQWLRRRGDVGTHRRPRTVRELGLLLQETQLVGSTCLGIRHPMFARRTFDVCIVDEAGQLTQPATLGPLRFADTFVLVGDHMQLPPVVRNAKAKADGYDESLFKRLCVADDERRRAEGGSGAHRSPLVQLRSQYRMAEPIMRVANTLFYEGMLQCGDPEKAQKRLEVSAEALAALPAPAAGCRNWLREVLAPRRAVVMANTDTMSEEFLEERIQVRHEYAGSGENRFGWEEGPRKELVPLVDRKEDERGRCRTARGIGGVLNRVEAELSAVLVRALLRLGVPICDIGVIAPYRAQLRHIRELLSKEVRGGLEVQTVDKFQGRDKPVVILSAVRSNKDREEGQLLKDSRRVNVAFTRAKYKLIVIGSCSTLSVNAKLEEFIAIAADLDGAVDLPPGAQSAYPALLDRPSSA